jgi:hypothetical protein
MEAGSNGRCAKYWVRLGCWISQCYDPFSLGAHFETYEPFISLIFKFFRAVVNRRYWIGRYGGTPTLCGRLWPKWPSSCKHVGGNHQRTILYQYTGWFLSLWNFWPLQYSSEEGHTEGEHVNRGRDTANFCPTLQVFDMSTLGDLPSTWQTFLAHAQQSRPMATAVLFVSQRTGSHSPENSCTTHELFCSQVVLCGRSETSVAPSQFTQFWQIPRHRTLSYSLSTPCFVTTAP